ncbi:MAG: oxidoreductase [Pedobacter sp.]|jgi:photosystem II stability/assembly factor-like uncharacterized protein|nr:oxidoreductase [Pedobacter sp.]
MRILLVLVMLAFQGYGQDLSLKQLTTGSNTSLRGLSVVSVRVAWVSGSNGYVGRTVNGGADWQWTQPKGFENLDFRDIEAFDDQKAVIVNAGSPAFILVTKDGGQSWTQAYVNRDSSIFLDGMDFWDNHTGIIFGDPIHSKLQLLKTVDGGASWKDISGNLKPEMKLGEAGFAASGSSIKAMGKGKVWIVTGGSVSNVYYSKNYGNSWEKYACPIVQGVNSTGAFSIDLTSDNNGIVVGGDYLKEKENQNNVLITSNGGRSWTKPTMPVFGYRSSVAYISDATAVAVGSSGVDVSRDRGLTWQHLSDLNFNAVKKAKQGNLVLVVGVKGDIFKLE